MKKYKSDEYMTLLEALQEGITLSDMIIAFLIGLNGALALSLFVVLY